MRTAFDETVGSGRVFLYDHFGSLATDNLLNRVRYLAKACNVGWVILDHLSIVVSGVDNGDERKAIDVIMTKLRSCAKKRALASSSYPTSSVLVATRDGRMVLKPTSIPCVAVPL